LVLGMMLPLVAAGGQARPDSLSIVRGDHIRIRASYTANWSSVGKVEELTTDSLRLVTDKRDTIWIPRWRVFSMEAHRGEELQRRVIAVTAGIGLIAGTIVSQVMCASDRPLCDTEDAVGQLAGDLTDSDVERDLVLGVASGLAGALVGWAIATPPRWEMAVWPRLDAGARQARGAGMVLAFRYSF
jgi:hypothetical protein